MCSSGAAVAPPAVRVNRMKVRRPAVEHPFEVSGDADRPGQGSGPQPDPCLDLVHQFQGMAAGTVPLVDHRNDRDPTVLTNLEQLQRLRLKAFRGVDEHHRGVDGRQHPVGVFGEVGVTRGIEQVDHAVAVWELQRRRCDRDAPGLLHLHPVRHRRATARFAVDRACFGDGPAVQRQCLGQRGFAGVGMADDGERSAAACLSGDTARWRSVGGRPCGQGIVGHSASDGIGPRLQTSNRARRLRPDQVGSTVGADRRREGDGSREGRTGARHQRADAVPTITPSARRTQLFSRRCRRLPTPSMCRGRRAS